MNATFSCSACTVNCPQAGSCTLSSPPVLKIAFPRPHVQWMTAHLFIANTCCKLHMIISRVSKCWTSFSSRLNFAKYLITNLSRNATCGGTVKRMNTLPYVLMSGRELLKSESTRFDAPLVEEVSRLKANVRESKSLQLVLVLVVFMSR